MMQEGTNRYRKEHTGANHIQNTYSDDGSDIDLLKLHLDDYQNRIQGKINHKKPRAVTELNNSRKIFSKEYNRRSLQKSTKSSPLINLVSDNNNVEKTETFSESTKKYRPLLKSFYTDWVPDILDDFKIPSSRRRSAPDNCITTFENQLSVDNQFRSQQKLKTHDKHKTKKSSYPTDVNDSLKISPNQVVYESKKLSIFRTIPHNTEINIKTDFHSSKQLSQQFSNKMDKLPEDIKKHFEYYKNPIYSDSETNVSDVTSNILNPEIKLEQLGYNYSEPLDWTKIEMHAKTNLYEELAQRINNFVLADCLVYIGNEEFSCHLIVLQSYSKYFENVTEKRIDLTKQSVITAEAFTLIYEWMISCEEESHKILTRENCLELLTAAKYLIIKELEEQCWMLINSEEIFNEDTAFMLFLDARQRNLSGVAELMIPRVRNFFLTLVSSQDYLELSIVDVCAFLSSNHIRINCEMEILMSAIRWLHHDWMTRQKYLISIMKCVRFGLFEPCQLIDIKRNPENSEILSITKNAEVLKMIDDGLAFVIIKHWYRDKNEDFTHWLESLRVEEPAPRNFSGINKNYSTYQQFLEYLDECRHNAIVAKKGYEKNFNCSKQKRNERIDTNDRGQKLNLFANDKKPIQTENSTKNIKKHNDKNLDPISRKSNTSNQLKQFLETVNPNSSGNVQNIQLYTVYQTMTQNNQQQVANVEIAPTVESDASYTPTDKNICERNSLFSLDHETVLVFGGIDSNSHYGIGRNTGKDVYRYVPETNVWEFVTELPEPRYHHSIAFLKERVFLVGGADPSNNQTGGKSTVVSTVWSFDPVNRLWFKETPLKTPRKNFGLVVDQQNLYAIGGQDNMGRVIKSVEKYDPDTGTWIDVTPLKSSRMGMAAAKYQNFIWVAGGMTSSKKCTLSCDVECYDPRCNQWTQFTRLRFARCFGHLFVMNDTLYLIGGAGRLNEMEATTASLEAIDVWSNRDKEWHLLTEMAISRHGHAVAYIGTQILMIGGVTTVYKRALSNVECFCVERCTWIKGVANFPTSISGHGAITLPPAPLL